MSGSFVSTDGGDDSRTVFGGYRATKARRHASASSRLPVLSRTKEKRKKEKKFKTTVNHPSENGDR
jgi:hypothetical protein